MARKQIRKTQIRTLVQVKVTPCNMIGSIIIDCVTRKQKFCLVDVAMQICDLNTEPKLMFII